MARDSFEVYYHQSGRWQVHSSFEANQRELAIEAAKAVEAKDGYPTRVVRETFNSDSNTSEEVVSWQSPKAKSMSDSDSMFGGGEKPKSKLKRNPPKQAPRQAEAPRAAPRPHVPKAGPAKPPRKPKRKSKGRGIAMRAFMVIITSFGLAAVLAVLVNLIAAYLPAIGIRPPDNRAQLFIGTFVLVFSFTFLVNLHRQFGLLSMLRGKPKAQQTPVREMAVRTKPKFTQDAEFDQVEIEDLREKIAEEDAAPPEEEAEEENAAPRELDADMGGEAFGGAEPAEAEPAPVEQPRQEAAAPQPVEKPVERPAPKAAEKPPEKPVDKTPQKTPAEVEARAGFGKFVSEVMNVAPGDQLNAFSRFGVNLYLAGAASVVGQTKRLPRDVQLQVLRDGLQSAGNSAERAEAFCVELPSYGKNPRYAGMVQAGAKSMTQQLSSGRSAAGDFSGLLNEWNLPEKRPTVPSVITFVFTDIVGSTEMTARLGNAGAQKAVRAHNTAVRNAIQAKGGMEVKHTGDGIMATFPSPAAAVTGSIQMQREIAAHNSANSTLQVNVRIGVNVGEAVQEENDFFGAAVQMTARICDKASKGNVWVSQAVVEACKGQKLGFIPRGRFEMKGIQGAKTLYEVGWTDAHKNELADL